MTPLRAVREWRKCRYEKVRYRECAGVWHGKRGLGGTESMWFVTTDTVGNCSVSQGKPSAGQTALGEAGGYASIADARKTLDGVRGDESKCKGVVE